MLNSNGSHERFEELAALAALGRVSKTEYRELQDHLLVCAACRASQADFLEILHEHLPLLDPQAEVTAPNVAFHDASYKQRFVERAARDGIHFSDGILGRRKGRGDYAWLRDPRRLAYAAAMLILLGAVGALSYRLGETRSRNAETGKVVKLTDEIKRLRSQHGQTAQQAPVRQTAGPVQGPRNVSESPSDAAFRQELSKVRGDYATTLARAEGVEEQLKKASLEVDSLRAELEAVRGGGSPESARLQQVELALRQANDELERLRRRTSLDSAALVAKQVEIRELNEKLTSHAETLERERELLAAGKDIRDLMGARNLHIIDVADVDSKGTQKPFGRVFYTEGKSLIFYAYDLEKKKNLQEKYSFQAWGQRGVKTGAAQSLGIFFSDDQKQNRWVLKYEDPRVLEQIDAVFVTIEPRGGSASPKGEQLMYAYLKANPNHP